MSTLEKKREGVTFVPVEGRGTSGAGWWTLLLAVVLPAVAIGVEISTGMCAGVVFDPLPTVLHTAAVSLVPISNFLVWLCLRNGRTAGLQRLAFAHGAAMAVAGIYALLFLPVLPLAILALLFYVMGALAIAPLAGFASGIILGRRLAAKASAADYWRPFRVGAIVSFLALLALDVPSAATHLGLQWATSSDAIVRQRGITLLRTLGDEEQLRRLCYDVSGRPTGLLSALVSSGGKPADVREIYYRVTGLSFNAKPAPHSQRAWARFDDFAFDADHGAAAVGGRIKGLTIASSRLDGSVSAEDGVAYLEWTFEFHNTSLVDREARLQLALPPGGVVSRATLWVNGEEQEAAYGGRAEVRAAYQRVAVQQRRDPLLVTTKGADRVLVQAFPVGRSGGTIKIKLGITAPLDISEAAKSKLALPAIVDRNFSFPSDLTHGVWIEADHSLSSSLTTLTASELGNQRFRLQGAVSDNDLAQPRLTISAARDAAATSVYARIEDGHVIRQDESTGVTTEAPAALMLVVDGSTSMKPVVSDIVAALEAIPSGRRVGAIIAADPLQMIEPRPWSDDQRTAIIRLLQSNTYVGGEDNAPALTHALQILEREKTASLLWMHGSQPINFRASSAQLEQAGSRLARLPSVTLYSIEPGPNELLPDAAWAWGARSLPRSSSPAADLSGFFEREFSTKPSRTLVRTEVQPDASVPKGSEHIVRLWAKDRILQLMLENSDGNRKTAVDLAVQYRLVTPVSGAVVLETKQQFDEARLTPVSKATVPTIPEPSEWALMVVAFGAFLWLVWMRRRSITGTL